jgi:hypothetical protein
MFVLKKCVLINSRFLTYTSRKRTFLCVENGDASRSCRVYSGVYSGACSGVCSGVCSLRAPILDKSVAAQALTRVDHRSTMALHSNDALSLCSTTQQCKTISIMKILVFPMSRLARVITAWSQSVPHALGDNGQPEVEHCHLHDVVQHCFLCAHGANTLMVQLGGPVAKRMNRRAQIGTKRSFI